MTDIITRNSDGRVLVVAPNPITTAPSVNPDRYEFAGVGGQVEHWPFAAFATATSVVHSVTPAVPADLAAGYNYNWSGSAFTASGTPAPPGPPAPGPWDGKAPISNGATIIVLEAAIGVAGVSQLMSDPASAPFYAELLADPVIDPNSADFQEAMGYLTTTNGANGQLLLTAANVTAIIAAWP